MYTIKFGCTRATLNTLGDVLVLMNANRSVNDSLPPLVEHIELTRDDEPLQVVKDSYGKYGVVQQGNAQEILKMMFEEVDRTYMRPDGVVRKPHQMRRAAWMAANAIGSASYNVYPCFTSEQRRQVCHYERPNYGERTGALSDFCEALFYDTYGFGHNGPAYDNSKQTNCRHEVHVAFALANGIDVPEDVLADYAISENGKVSNSAGDWFKPLLQFPRLRGAIPVEKFRTLYSVMLHSHLEFTTENIAGYIEMMREFDKPEPHYAEMDDFLYQKGVLQPYPDSDPKPAADLSLAVSPLALKIREHIINGMQAVQKDRADTERKKGNISLREYERTMRNIENEAKSFSLEGANRIAQAVADRNLPFLLQLLDGPDDHNNFTKRALREHLGFNLLNLKAAQRRAAIFTFCGYDAERRTAYENEITEKRRIAALEREKKDAIQQVEQARWQTTGGQLVSGKEYVDSAVAEGFTTISTRPKGRTVEYWLTNPQTGASKNILAKDGTLAYAQIVHGLPMNKQAA